MPTYRRYKKTHKSRKTRKRPKAKSICRQNGLKFEDCELFILRQNVDEIERVQARKVLTSPEIIRIFNIVEDFIRDKKLVVYGGQAINAMLPVADQFYRVDTDLPDWDCYDSTPIKHAKQLCDHFVREGFENVEAKSGQHFGTYKIFVNFNPVLDLTYTPPALMKELQSRATKLQGTLYSPINFLRMNMYLELSRPQGNVGRWEKVVKRLALLNKHYPLHITSCSEDSFERPFEGGVGSEMGSAIYKIVTEMCVQLKCVFFGSRAFVEYSRFMPKTVKIGGGENRRPRHTSHSPDFDILSESPERHAEEIKAALETSPLLKKQAVRVKRHEPVGEIIGESYEITVGKDTVAFIYATTACHSYNEVSKKIYGRPQTLRIATIDTILSFYLAFLFAGRSQYDIARIECMAQYLFRVQETNRLAQRGVLKRFSLSCLGRQETPEDMRAEKAAQYNALRNKRGSAEFERWFLNYAPASKLKKEIKTVKPTRTKKHVNKKGSRKKKRRPKKDSVDQLIRQFVWY